LHRGASAPTVAESVRLSPQAVRNIAQRYRMHGLDRALYERPRPGAAEVRQTADKQRIIVMVCADPPTGAARWTVRLIAEQVVKRRLGRPGDDSRVVAEPRPRAVAGRQCGASLTSTPRVSQQAVARVLGFHV